MRRAGSANLLRQRRPELAPDKSVGFSEIRSGNMTQQSSNYRYGDRERTLESGVAAAGDRARELGEEALDRAEAMLRPVGLSIRERPMTCLALVGGFAFAAGAVWMLRNSRRQSRMDEFMQQVSEFARRPRWW